jgi:hypothetical protein
MKYEFKYVTIKLTESQQEMLALGVANMDAVNDMVLELINEEGKDGWEALFPFSFPSVWFKRPIKTATRRKTTTRKKKVTTK